MSNLQEGCLTETHITSPLPELGAQTDSIPQMKVEMGNNSPGTRNKDIKFINKNINPTVFIKPTELNFTEKPLIYKGKSKTKSMVHRKREKNIDMEGNRGKSLLDIHIRRGKERRASLDEQKLNKFLSEQEKGKEANSLHYRKKATHNLGSVSARSLNINFESKEELINRKYIYIYILII